MGKMRITREDYVKANRKASREEELAAHGRPVRIGGVHQSKKVYNRKRSKAEMKKALPYFFEEKILRHLKFVLPAFFRTFGYLEIYTIK